MSKFPLYALSGYNKVLGIFYILFVARKAMGIIMPAFSTHYIFAEEMMEKVKEIADFDINKNAVLIGTQGPDIFFFHRAFPWQKGKPLRKLGSALHREKAGKLLNRLYEYCQKTNSDIAKSYAFGFILHYALDRICHPYVYYLQNKITDSQPKFNPHSAHNIIELSLDSLMLSFYLNVEKPTLFETEKAIDLTENELKEISDEISFLADVSSESVKTAILDMKNMQRLLLDKKGRKKQIIASLEKMVSPFTKNFLLSSYFRTDDLEKAKEYANIYHNKWKSPFCDKISNDSFFDLYEKAKADAEKLLIKWQNGADGEAITNNLSFLTGVEVK